MNASLTAFADSIQKLSREELIRLLMEMEAARQQDAAIIAEFRRTSTDMHREYSRMEMELKGARADLKDIEKKYAHVCEYNASLLKQLYGRRSEKLSGLESAIPEACGDPLFETAEPADAEPVPDCPVENRRRMDGTAGRRGRKTAGKKHAPWKSSRLSMPMNWMSRNWMNVTAHTTGGSTAGIPVPLLKKSLLCIIRRSPILPSFLLAWNTSWSVSDRKTASTLTAWHPHLWLPPSFTISSSSGCLCTDRKKTLCRWDSRSHARPCPHGSCTLRTRSFPWFMTGCVMKSVPALITSVMKQLWK